MTSWEKGALTLAGALALAAGTFDLITPAVDPVLAAATTAPPTAFVFLQEQVDLGRQRSWELSQKDPWGRRWRAGALRDLAGKLTIDPCFIYSAGPDGVDALGGGDDITGAAVAGHPVVRCVPHIVLASPRGALANAFALIVASTLVTGWASRAPRASVAREALRAAAMIALPAVAIAPWLAFPVEALDAPPPGWLVVPPRLALALTWPLLLFLPAFAWRLSRPTVTAG